MKTEENIPENKASDLNDELFTEKPEFSNKTTQPTDNPQTESIPPPPSIEETSKQQSEPGEEIILYAEGFDNSPEVKKIQKFFNSYLIYSFSFFTSLLFVSIGGIWIYIRQTPDFSLMVIGLIYYHFFQIPQAGWKIKAQWNSRVKIFRNIMNLANHISFGLSLTGILLFLLGAIEGPAMFYFTIINVLVQIIRYTCTNYSEELIVSVPFLNLIAAMCLMMISIKLESPINHAAWGFVLLWYYLFYYFSIIVLVCLITCGILFVYFSIFDAEIMREIEPSKIKLSLTLGVMLFLLIVCVCSLMSGVKVFLELGLISPNPRSQSMPSFLYKSSVFAALYSVLMIGIILAVYFFYRDAIIRKLFKFEGKTISFKTYLSNLKLKISRVGANYFVKKSRDQKESEYSIKAGEINFCENEKCMICCENQNCILLQPCKHYIFCEDCVVDFLKQKSCCPMCKVKIEKAVVMFFDAEKNEYFATKEIKLNEDINAV